MSQKDSTATNPYVPRVAAIFDFDRTLASDTIDALCAAWGMSREEWEGEYLDPLGDGWDNIIKRGQALIDCGRDRDAPLDRDFFARAAERVEVFSGVTELRARLEESGRKILPELEVELVVLSSGYAELIERTAVADSFDRIWAGAFHCDAEGRAVAVKRIIGHAEKSLYIEGFAKGLNLDAANAPERDRVGFAKEDMHIPFDQIIYVGDGASDLNAFEFLTSRGGLALAVDKDQQFDHVEQQTEAQRVENLVPPDYSEDGEMLASLRHAVRSAASRAALRKLGEGE